MERFTVVDNKTGCQPDCEKIAREEMWAKHLCYCDIDCFAITEDGALVLMDECGSVAYCPADRFTVVREGQTMDELKPCPFCGGEAEIRDCGRIIKKQRRPFYTIRCSACMGTVPKYSSTILQAIEVWNRRA